MPDLADLAPSFAVALWKRFERVIRYGFVGVGVTFFYTLITVGLLKGRVVTDPTLATAIASVVTLPVSFLAHRSITFSDVAPHRAQWARFGVLASLNFVVCTGSMKIVDLCGGPFWIGLIIGYVVVPVSNYAVKSLWVFRTKTFFAVEK